MVDVVFFIDSMSLDEVDDSFNRDNSSCNVEQPR